jgi:hypothetical protein
VVRRRRLRARGRPRPLPRLIGARLIVDRRTR